MNSKEKKQILNIANYYRSAGASASFLEKVVDTSRSQQKRILKKILARSLSMMTNKKMWDNNKHFTNGGIMEVLSYDQEKFKKFRQSKWKKEENVEETMNTQETVREDNDILEGETV